MNKYILLFAAIITSVTLSVGNNKIHNGKQVQGIRLDRVKERYYVNITNINPSYKLYSCIAESGLCMVLTKNKAVPGYDTTCAQYYFKSSEVLQYDEGLYTDIAP